MSSFQWITLQQARKESFGEVAWWRLVTPNGECILEPSSQIEQKCPVWKGTTGTMYLGGWKDGKWNGLGVFYFPDGCVLSGYWDKGTILGKAMHVLLPESPAWKANHWPRSLLMDQSQKRSLPFIYIGGYQNFFMHDDDAIVILKDGTTRRGPWRNNAPVGDWWKDHDASTITWEQMSLLLSFDSKPECCSATVAIPHDTGVDPVVVPCNDEQYPSMNHSIQDPTVCSSTSSIVGIISSTIERRTSWQSGDEDEEKHDTEEMQFQSRAETIISEWLYEILHPDANPYEMKYYASRLYQDGFHSIDLIQEYCSIVDVRDYMKKAHIRILSIQFQSEQRIQSIALWLHKIVLGPNLHQWEAYNYAIEMVEEGLLSISDIREFCTPDDVANFVWMKPFHRRRLVQQLEKYSP